MTKRTLGEVLGMAVALHREGRVHEAAPLYAQAVAAFPEHPEANRLLGVATFRIGEDIPGALGLVARALALNPATSGAKQNFLNFQHDVFPMAEARLAAGRLAEFLALYVAVIEARATANASYLMRQYFALTATESLLMALDRAEGLRMGWPAEIAQSFDGRLLSGLRLLERGRIEPGADALSALAHAVAEPERVLRIAKLLLHYKRPHEARALAAPLAETGSLAGEALHVLGKAAWWAGDFGQAMTALNGALEANPRAFAAAIDLGASHLLAQDAGAAAGSFQRALAILPTLPWASLGLGLARMLEGRADEALVLVEGVVAAVPDLIEAQVTLGTLRMDFDPSAALENFRNAVNLRIGQQFSPLPPGPTLYESMRGYSDAIYAQLARRSQGPLAPVTAKPVTFNEEKYAEYPVRVGRLADFAGIPDDGRYHPRDPESKVMTRRIGPPEHLAMPLPLNIANGGAGARARFFGATLFSWLAFAYRRFAWHKDYPFPQFAGSDGTFISRLENGRVLNNAVFSENLDFFDESTNFDELALLGIGAGNSGFKTGDDGAQFLRVLDPPTRINQPHLILAGYHAHNYGVWLVNVLPKIIHFEALEETRGLPIALAPDLFERPYVLETLAAMGVDETRIMALGNGSYTFKTAYCASTGAHLMTPSAVRAVRERLCAGFQVTPRLEAGRVLYISRRDAILRRVLNEDRLVELLERYGAEVVVNTGMGMAEIAQLFAQARCVIGVNGAGMMNTLFCPTGAIVVELANDLMIEPLFWMVSNVIGLEHHVVAERALNRRGDFSVDLDAVEAILRRL